MSTPTLNSGKCNAAIEIVKIDGQDWVRRLYAPGIVDEPLLRWKLDIAAGVGLVKDPDWRIQETAEGTWVANPRQQILGLRDVSTDVLWEAYEDFLTRLKELYTVHRAIVSDAHSANIVLCAEEGGAARLYIVDGKVAGIQTEPSLHRLAIKYKNEQVEEHRWLLWEYRAFLKERGAC